MCMEPESLVPITCSGARQVVLIGDHKQLQPVIQDHVAKTLGLSVSMFERHSKRALMLKLQYRMVRELKKISCIREGLPAPVHNMQPKKFRNAYFPLVINQRLFLRCL